MNLFKKAIENDQIFEFITGKGEYFVLDREYGEHSCRESFRMYVIPFLKENDLISFGINTWNLIIKELNVSKDINEFLENLVEYLSMYYTSDDSKINSIRLQNTPIGFFEKFNEVFINQKDFLKVDKRGTGAEWNVSNGGQGRFGGISYNLKLLKGKGGPEFISGID